jgi:hypothetical protein
MFQEVEASRFQDSQHMKVVRLSALRTGRLYLPGDSPGTHFQYRPSRTQNHSAAGRIPMTPSGIEPATLRLVAQRLATAHHIYDRNTSLMCFGYQADNDP